MAESGISYDENKREYSRVDSHLPLEYRLIPRDQKDSVRSRLAGEMLLAEFKELPNPDDQLISLWLQNINAKLDVLIRMMTLHYDGFNCLQMTKVNISGGGMSFKTETNFSPGDVLEIKVSLLQQKPVSMFLYGEVVESSTSTPEYNTSVQFINMDDSIRDQLIRFVFETEREILREKRR